MPTSDVELKNLKLQTISLDGLKELATKKGIEAKGTKTLLVEKLLKVPQSEIDAFIKEKYIQRVADRQKIITDEELERELSKVEGFRWSVVQGALDQKIQSEYVRKYFRYDQLISGVEGQLFQDVAGYVAASWFNHWTTVLIEDHISLHPKVVPTLTNRMGIDIFFDGEPFDLKVTYLPRQYSYEHAVKEPKALIKWLYENQGALRFGDDNRLFVVLADSLDPASSWKLKRQFDLLYREIDNFFSTQSVTSDDEIVFTFGKNTYTTTSKILLITN